MDSLKVVQKVVLEKKGVTLMLESSGSLHTLTLTPWTRMCSAQQHQRCCRASEMTVGWARLDVRFWEKAEVQHPLIMCSLRCGKVRSAYCAPTSNWAWWEQEVTAGAGTCIQTSELCYLHFFLLLIFLLLLFGFWLLLEVKFKPWSWQRDWGKIALLHSVLHR